MRKLALTSLIAVLLVGCSSGAAKDASYSTAADLRADLQAAGLPCADWSDDDTTGKFDAGKCDGLQIRVYPDTQARELDTGGIVVGGMFAALEAQSETLLITNKNWSAFVPADKAESVASKLGGDVIDPADYDMADLLTD